MPAKVVLVTGEQGFLGALLVKKLESQNDLSVHIFGGDITDREFCVRRLNEIQPDVVVHLAALSLPKACDEQPDLAIQVNVEGTRNIADAAKTLDKNVHLVFTSTAQVYDYQELSFGFPIDEACKIAPQNLYAETKLAGEQLLTSSSYRCTVKTTVLRLFNHVHKSQQSATYMSSIYSQVLALQSAGKTTGTLTTGDLNLYRELNPVQSLLNLLVALCGTSPTYDYEIFNVCSGKSRQLQTVANAFAAVFGMTLKFELNPALLRKNDPKMVVGSNEKIKKILALQYADLTDEELVRYFCAEI